MNALIRSPEGYEAHVTGTAEEIVRVWREMRGSIIPIDVTPPATTTITATLPAPSGTAACGGSH